MLFLHQRISANPLFPIGLYPWFPNHFHERVWVIIIFAIYSQWDCPLTYFQWLQHGHLYTPFFPPIIIYQWWCELVVWSVSVSLIPDSILSDLFNLFSFRVFIPTSYQTHLIVLTLRVNEGGSTVSSCYCRCYFFLPKCYYNLHIIW